MTGLINKVRTRYQIVRNYRSFKNKAKRNQQTAGAPSVFFHLSDIRQEPYYYPLIFSFSQAGYNILIADNKKFIGHSFGAGKFIFDLPLVCITNKPGSMSLLITDSPHFFESAPVNKKILLKSAISHKEPGLFFLPYPMHPNAYRNGYFRKFKELRQTARKSRVLFSGNTDPVAYSNPIIMDRFGKINRVKVLDTLLNNFNSEQVISIKDKGALKNIPKPYFNGAVFYLWQWSPSHSESLDIRVENDQWHEFLAKGDFFLCCPGIVIPLSHNAIEAMAVGTIPFLQYPELFHPALQDGINCIRFNNSEDMVSKMNEVFAMDDGKIAQMRQAVINYYEDYLSHERPYKLINDLAAGKNEIYFYNEAV